MAHKLTHYSTMFRQTHSSIKVLSEIQTFRKSHNIIDDVNTGWCFWDTFDNSCRRNCWF